MSGSFGIGQTARFVVADATPVTVGAGPTPAGAPSPQDTPTKNFSPQPAGEVLPAYGVCERTKVRRSTACAHGCAHVSASCPQGYPEVYPQVSLSLRRAHAYRVAFRGCDRAADACTGWSGGQPGWGFAW